MYTFILCQENKKLLQQHDPYVTNKYYFSLLPSDISKIIPSYYSDNFRPTHQFESLLDPKIDKALIMNKICDAALWASFNRSIYGNCLFRTAFIGGNTLCAQLYLTRGKDPTYSHGRYESNSPLELAVINDHWQVVGILLSAGADPNYRVSRYDGYPIYTAVKSGNLQCASLLLTNGANKNLDKSLIEAASNQDVQMVKLLLDNGAKISPNRYHFAMLCNKQKRSKMLLERIF